MKNLIFALLILFGFTAYSQNVGISLGGNIATDSEFSESLNYGYNAGIMLQLPVLGVHGILQGTYNAWDEKTIEDEKTKTEPSVTNFPVLLIGARKYIGKFYVSALTGIYPLKLKVKTTDKATGEEFNYESSETQGALVPGIGGMLDISSFTLDISGNYLWTQDYSQIDFKLIVWL